MAEAYSILTQEFETIIDFLRFAITKANSNDLFYGHGTDNVWDDMTALILESLYLPLDVDPRLLHGKLTQEEKLFLCLQLERRIEDRVPVPYLTNKAYFCDLPFHVDERVLIPRSPIGELITQQFSPWIAEDRVQRILDLCTGSGCIAIACCYSFPDALVDAVDISQEAIDVAEMNREFYNLEGSLTLMNSDCFDSIPEVRYDIIVSNPPYVGHDEMISLPAEYLHEPRLALETERNGLAIVEKILHQAKNYLTDHGILVVEVGNSEEALIEAYPNVPFTWLDFERGGTGVFLLTHDQLNQYFSS
jgi:ribosomal protein L3 glutamine methyltransferase